MALLIPALLIGTGVLIAVVNHTQERYYYQERSNDLSRNTFAKLFVAYCALLLLAALSCFALGAYAWLKDGVWWTASPAHIVHGLDAKSRWVVMLLADIPWLGVSEIGAWYLRQNMGWTFLATIAILVAVLSVMPRERG